MARPDRPTDPTAPTIRRLQLGLLAPTDASPAPSAEASPPTLEGELAELGLPPEAITVTSRDPSADEETRMGVVIDDAVGSVADSPGRTPSSSETWPPTERRSRLRDPRVAEAFLTRAATYARWRAQRTNDPSPSGLVAFHARHKLVLMAHAPATQKELGRLVAQAGARDADAVWTEYGARCLQALTQPASRTRHRNVLEHLAGYLKGELTSGDKFELHKAIQDYELGNISLHQVMAIMQPHLTRLGHPWVEAQQYFEPFPGAAELRRRL